MTEQLKGFDVHVVKGITNEEGVPRESVSVGNFVEQFVGLEKVIGFGVESDKL